MTVTATVTYKPSVEDLMLMQLTLQGYKTNHILHFIISVVTIGLWVVIWLLVAANNTRNRNNIRKLYKQRLEFNWAGFFLLLPFILVAIILYSVR